MLDSQLLYKQGEAFSRILQNKSFGMALGNVKLFGKIGKIHVFIVIENKKFANKEIVILNFGYSMMFFMVEVAK